jgi:hypothetical protein
MPLPCPGPAPISLLDIQNEFGGDPFFNSYTRIDEYYRGGQYVENNETNSRIPTSGQISFADFFCSSGEIVVFLDGKYENLIVSNVFGTLWSSVRRKKLILGSNAIVYSSNASKYALTASSPNGGPLTIENRGKIIGASGSGGNAGVGGNGGSAIKFNSGNQKITFINTSGGLIAGGGGGGGAGGKGTDVRISSGASGFGINGTVIAYGGSGGSGAGYIGANYTDGTSGTSSNPEFTGQFNNSYGVNLYASLARLGATQVTNSGSMNLNFFTGEFSSAIQITNSGSINIDWYIANNTSVANLSNSGSMNANLYLPGPNIFATVSNSGTANIDIRGNVTAVNSTRVSNSGAATINRYYETITYSPRVDSYYIRYNLQNGYREEFTIIPSGAGRGGSGGYLGEPGKRGNDGTTSTGFNGGAAGFSIDGVNNITGSNSGTIYGPIK